MQLKTFIALGELPTGLVVLIALYLLVIYRLLRDMRERKLTQSKTAIVGGVVTISGVLLVALLLLVSSAITGKQDQGHEWAKWFFYLYGLPIGIFAGMMILFRRYRSGGFLAIGAGFMAFLAAVSSLVVVTVIGMLGTFLVISGGVLGLVSKERIGTGQ